MPQTTVGDRTVVKLLLIGLCFFVSSLSFADDMYAQVNFSNVSSVEFENIRSAASSIVVAGIDTEGLEYYPANTGGFTVGTVIFSAGANNVSTLNLWRAEIEKVGLAQAGESPSFNDFVSSTNKAVADCWGKHKSAKSDLRSCYKIAFKDNARVQTKADAVRFNDWLTSVDLANKGELSRFLDEK